MQHPSITTQIISTIGALFCLIAYAMHQLRRMDTKSFTYNLLNIIGSGILVYIAFKPFQAGFVLMESVWFLVSIFALWKVISSRVRK